MAASCPAQIRETQIAFGFKKQTNLSTINPVADMWSLTKTNPSLASVVPVMETNAEDIGKGDEFPSQTFKSNVDVTVPIEKYASSEFLAWVFAFSTGAVTPTAAGTGWKYEAVPSDPVTACLNLPPFTYAEQIRVPASESVVDRAMVGCVVGGFQLSMASGPGRANCRVTATLVGSGRVTQPSAITPWPVPTVEHFLNAASATISFLGIDYVLNQSFISLEFGWENNVRLDTGFYPGSGTQNGFAVRGRMEYGPRVCTLTFVARARKNSEEMTALMSQTEGTGLITLTGAVIGAGPSTHGMTITIPRMTLSAVEVGEDAGIVTVNVTATILKQTGQPYIKMAATTEKVGIGTLAGDAEEEPAAA